jgi:hypothetical protein
MRRYNMELDLLGDLLTEALKFRDSGFDKELVLRDETTISDITAKDMFREIDGRWFMRQESIPGDLSVKAIAVDGDGLYIETAPLNDKFAKEVIVEEMLPVLFNTKECNFVDIHKQQILVSLSEPKKLEKDLGARCLWTVLLQDVSEIRRQTIIKLIDLFYSRGCFEAEGDEELIAAPISQAMVQKLSLGLQQRLVQEQRPLLSLKNQLNVSGQLQLRTELRMLLTIERRIVSMQPEELLDFVVDYVSEHGEERTKNILLFTIAGKIKRTIPKLTWKEARKLARKVTLAKTA